MPHCQFRDINNKPCEIGYICFLTRLKYNFTALEVKYDHEITGGIVGVVTNLIVIVSQHIKGDSVTPVTRAPHHTMCHGSSKP